MTIALTACREKGPVIDSIDPRIGMMGEVLSIRGERFGSEQGESFVTIGGISPTASSYLRWSPDLIQVKIPEFGEAGLVYVHTGGKKSNPALFSNLAALPEPVAEAESGADPQIASVEPAGGAVGTLVTIKGANFGAARESSGVFFSWSAEPSPAAPKETRAPETIEASDAELGYDFWSDREIRVRVPDGAVSGNIELKTARGASKPFFFEVTGKPGTKVFRDKRSYTVTYSVDLRIREAFSPNTLYLWMPRPVTSSSQRNVTLLSRNREPFVENYRGVSLYQFANSPANSSLGVILSFVADVYAVETSLRAQSIKQDLNSPMHTLYTIATALIPSDDERIKEKAAAIVGKEKNPYLKARKIYEYLIKEGGIESGVRRGGALEGLAEKRCDSFQSALLFCALARAGGVPAIPAAGVLVNRNRSADNHYWAEFWIDGFGWIPLDPALGAGAAPPLFNLRQDHGAYYFGNLDNQRIAFSRGQTALSQMDPRGRVAVRTRDYALQNLWEEASGGLESYSSLWSGITITGIYSQ